MNQFGRLEQLFTTGFAKKAPYHLSKDAKLTIVQLAPWISLLFGMLQLWAAASLWNLARLNNSNLLLYAQTLPERLGVTDVMIDSHFNLFFWLSVGLLLLTGLMLILAFAGLRDRIKTGWYLVYYATLLNGVYAGLILGAQQTTSVTRATGAGIISLVVIYVLFQIRPDYHKTTSSKSLS